MWALGRLRNHRSGAQFSRGFMISRHVYDGPLWDSVADKVEMLTGERPIMGETIAYWLDKIDKALDCALKIKIDAEFQKQTLYAQERLPAAFVIAEDATQKSGFFKRDPFGRNKNGK